MTDRTAYRQRVATVRGRARAQLAAIRKERLARMRTANGPGDPLADAWLADQMADDATLADPSGRAGPDAPAMTGAGPGAIADPLLRVLRAAEHTADGDDGRRPEDGKASAPPESAEVTDTDRDWPSDQAAPGDAEPGDVPDAAPAGSGAPSIPLHRDEAYADSTSEPAFAGDARGSSAYAAPDPRTDDADAAPADGAPPAEGPARAASSPPEAGPGAVFPDAPSPPATEDGAPPLPRAEDGGAGVDGGGSLDFAPAGAEPTPATDDGDLGEIPGVGPGLLWMLRSAGVGSLADLACADEHALARKLGPISRLLDLGYFIEFARSRTPPR